MKACIVVYNPWVHEGIVGSPSLAFHLGRFCFPCTFIESFHPHVLRWHIYSSYLCPSYICKDLRRSTTYKLTKPIGWSHNYLGELPSTMHRGYNGTDKRRTKILWECCRVILATQALFQKLKNHMWNKAFILSAR